MIKCPNCGFSNNDNCTFCAICGSSVTQDNFYVHNTTSTDFLVEALTEKLISKNKEENAKTKSFKKLDKATIAKEAAKIEVKDEAVKEYKGSSKNNTDKNKKLPTDNSTNNEIESENTAVTKENKDNTQNPDSKTNPAKEDINNKENAEADIKSDEKTKPEIKNEENKNIEPTANSEEIPNSAKGSTDGELYKLLSRFFFDTKNENSLLKQDDIDENCNLAIISYIPFLFFIPMIIKPCSGYLRYHGIQGLTMFLTFIILEFFNIIMGAICNSVFNDMLGTILTVIITVVINLAILLLISIGIANAVKGAARELPIIGKYKLLKPYIY